MKNFVLLSCIIAITLLSFISSSLVIPSVWPQPKVFTTGDEDFYFTQLKFETDGGEIATLSSAYDRYTQIAFPHAPSSSSNSAFRVKVSVQDRSEAYPQFETDESYSLSVQSQKDITLTAKTVYGALRGLETLSQLIIFDFNQRQYYIPATPIAVEDAPRYAHRGLLLDTSRHYQPIRFLKQTIDSLSYAKYNVLHWHVVDTQSFPFESRTYPKLWNGAFTSAERYSQEDIKELVEYGRQRGVKIMIEFDMPGHAASWCNGYPEICPATNCLQPLNPASNLTFPLITSLLSECTGVGEAGEATKEPALFPYGLLHLGGDEVNYNCWTLSSEIQAWEKANGFASNEETYKYFVDKAATITRQQNRLPVQWVEVFEHFGANLDKNTIVHVWKEKETLDGVLQAGYRALLSNQGLWYLDHLDTDWKGMYGNEPEEGLSASSDPALILGGESCMWGETVDPSDVMATIWPRAAAVGEVLWSPKELVYGNGTIDYAAVEPRLQTFRCLLTQRGIGAAPVKNKNARSAPPEPGSCYVQRRL